MTTEAPSNQTELNTETNAYNDEDFIRQEDQKYMMHKIGQQNDNSHTSFRIIHHFSQKQ